MIYVLLISDNIDIVSFLMMKIISDMILCVFLIIISFASFLPRRSGFRLTRDNRLGGSVVRVWRTFLEPSKEITHTICYANGHTNQPFFGEYMPLAQLKRDTLSLVKLNGTGLMG